MDEFKLIDSYYNNEERIVVDKNELRNVLKSFLVHRTRVVILKSPNSGSLTIGLGEPYGFVEYINENSEPPYLVAAENEIESSGSLIEFDSGGTLTPVPRDRCLPIETVVAIAVYFFENRRLPEYVKWHAV